MAFCADFFTEPSFHKAAGGTNATVYVPSSVTGHPQIRANDPWRNSLTSAPMNKFLTNAFLRISVILRERDVQVKQEASRLRKPRRHSRTLAASRETMNWVETHTT